MFVLWPALSMAEGSASRLAAFDISGRRKRGQSRLFAERGVTQKEGSESTFRGAQRGHRRKTTLTPLFLFGAGVAGGGCVARHAAEAPVAACELAQRRIERG